MTLFNEFDSLFSKVWNNFSRPVADQYPFKTIKKENGYVIVCNTLGLAKEDVQVNIESKKGSPYPILKVSGETAIENISFQNKVNLGIQLRMEQEIESVKYEVKNGLTTIFIKTKSEDPVKNIKAEYSDGSLDF